MKVGKISEKVLKRSVLKPIKYKRNEIINGAGIGEDCAIFESSGDAVLVSCVNEIEIMESGSILRGIQKCANNIAASGAEPFALMLTLILPEEIEEPMIRKYMEEAENICAELKMQIAGGHTTISKAVSLSVMSVTAFGKGTRSHVRATRGAQPGQDIVVSKWIGLEGTALLARMYAKELKTRYPSWLIKEAESFDRYLSIIPEAATAIKSGVCVMHDASEGGIFAACWELAESTGVGLSIDLKKLPIRQETVEICEFCGRNPYELLSGGCLVMTADDGTRLAEALLAEGIPAAVVGTITDNRDKIVINDDEIRYLNRPDSDEIYKTEKKKGVYKLL